MHENLAVRVRDILWRVRQEILTVAILSLGYSTKLSAKRRMSARMLNFHVRRVIRTCSRS